MWCGAAAEWLKSRATDEAHTSTIMGCVLFPLNMIHHDSKTLTSTKGSTELDKSGKSLDIRGDGVVLRAKYKERFPEWIEYSWSFHRFFGSNCRHFRYRCSLMKQRSYHIG